MQPYALCSTCQCHPLLNTGGGLRQKSSERSQHGKGGMKMKSINIPMLLLAFLVVLLFILVGLAVAFRNIWFVLLLTVLAFGIFGMVMSQKKGRK